MRAPGLPRRPHHPAEPRQPPRATAPPPLRPAGPLRHIATPMSRSVAARSCSSNRARWKLTSEGGFARGSAAEIADRSGTPAFAPALARDAMIRHRGMNDVGAARGGMWQPTQSSSRLCCEPGRRREAATPVGVALQAAFPEIGRLLAVGRQPVGIMAGDAPEPAAAGTETTALVHLLDLTDETVLVATR